MENGWAQIIKHQMESLRSCRLGQKYQIRGSGGLSIPEVTIHRQPATSAALNVTPAAELIVGQARLVDIAVTVKELMAKPVTDQVFQLHILFV